MNNFKANIHILADYVNELYVKTVAYDKEKSGKGRTIYRDIPGLMEIGRYLVDK